MMRIHIDDHHVFELALVPLPRRILEQFLGIEFLDTHPEIAFVACGEFHEPLLPLIT